LFPHTNLDKPTLPRFWNRFRPSGAHQPWSRTRGQVPSALFSRAQQAQRCYAPSGIWGLGLRKAGVIPFVLSNNERGEITVSTQCKQGRKEKIFLL